MEEKLICRGGCKSKKNTGQKSLISSNSKCRIKSRIHGGRYIPLITAPDPKQFDQDQFATNPLMHFNLEKIRLKGTSLPN